LVVEKNEHGKQLAKSIFIEHLFSCPISLKKMALSHIKCSMVKERKKI
jgi:hypothetical protein